MDQTKNTENGFNTVEEALEDLRQGKLILVTDDPDRENEGDFICAAEYATTENINFMAVHGKGLMKDHLRQCPCRCTAVPAVLQCHGHHGMVRRGLPDNQLHL